MPQSQESQQKPRSISQNPLDATQGSRQSNPQEPPKENSQEAPEGNPQEAPQEPPKRKRGRPRSFEKGTTIAICVSIETRQKEWLDEVAASAPQESASKVVREALDLWYAVHKEGKTLVGAVNPPSSSISDDDDDFDYSWQ